MEAAFQTERGKFSNFAGMIKKKGSSDDIEEISKDEDEDKKKQEEEKRKEEERKKKEEAEKEKKKSKEKPQITVNLSITYFVIVLQHLRYSR